MAKKKHQPASDDPKPIVISVTIYPPKKDKRRVIVSAAPEGEMPLIIDGLFPERHALLDRAFAGVLKREPQMVNLTTDSKADKRTKTEADEDHAEDSETTEAGDQLVSEDEPSLPTPLPESGEGSEAEPIMAVIDSGEELPAIEGDAADADNAGLPTEAIGSDDEEVGNDGEQD